MPVAGSRTIRFLVTDSETAQARQARRESAGRSSAETFADTLGELVPHAQCDFVRPHETGPDATPPDALEAYDAVFFCGSPLHVYEDTPETRRQLAFMRAVFASGTPGFGSCAGLQVAVVAAGGQVAKADRHEIAFARRITASAAGAAHPMLAGRPAAWDALAIHSDAVTVLPPGATLLAGNAACPVQAAEIRCGGGVFWGVQYHPELEIGEVAAAIRRQCDDVIAQGAARTVADVEAQAALIDALAAAPGRRDLAWRLGLDEEVTRTDRRRRELTNFIATLVPAAGGRTPEA